ncbi:MAG: hypothetical protein Fur0046_36510 [Cyanobacteria bacterium J069]
MLKNQYSEINAARRLALAKQAGVSLGARGLTAFNPAFTGALPEYEWSGLASASCGFDLT